MGGEEHVMLCSSSENSDILTLPDSCEAEIDAWKEPVAKEAKEAGSDEFYLGSSSSSQYTFRESETSEWKMLPSIHVGILVYMHINATAMP